VGGNRAAPALIPLALLAALIVLGGGIPLALSTWRFRTVWRMLAPRYPPADREVPLKPADQVRKTYCEVHVAERTAASPGFTVEATPGGFALVPGLWHRTLPPLWFPWAAIADCKLMTRTIGRLIVHCVRLRLADGDAWMQVDSPAGERLYRFWFADTDRRRKTRAT